jgi:hypothetical protein
MPPDQSVWFDDDECAAPVKELAQKDHEEPCCVGGAVRLDFALLKERELFAEEQSLGGQRAARSATQRQ